MSVSRLLRPLLATLVAGAAFLGSAQAQVALQPSVPFNPSGVLAPQMPFGTQPSAAGAHHGGLRALDLNGDRMLSREEIQSRRHLARQFDSIDTNRDGELSRDELRAWHAAHPKGEHGGARAARQSTVG